MNKHKYMQSLYYQFFFWSNCLWKLISIKRWGKHSYGLQAICMTKWSDALVGFVYMILLIYAHLKNLCPTVWISMADREWSCLWKRYGIHLLYACMFLLMLLYRALTVWSVVGIRKRISWKTAWRGGGMLWGEEGCKAVEATQNRCVCVCVWMRRRQVQQWCCKEQR